MMAAPPIPEFIDPADISKFDDDKMEAFLDGIRERRLRAYRVYKQAEEERQLLEDEKAREQLMKQNEMLFKGIEQLDKKIDAVEKRALKVRALRVQLGMDV